jgi:hypothetical protein
VYVDESGYVKEMDNDHLGYKDVDGGGLIDGNARDPSLLQGLIAIT